MGSEYKVPAAELKAEVVEQSAKRIRSLPQRKALAEAALEVTHEAVAEDNFETARQMGKQAGAVGLADEEGEHNSRHRNRQQGTGTGGKGGGRREGGPGKLRGPRRREREFALGEVPLHHQGRLGKGPAALRAAAMPRSKRWPSATCMGQRLPRNRPGSATPGSGPCTARSGLPIGIKALPGLKSLERDRCGQGSWANHSRTAASICWRGPTWRRTCLTPEIEQLGEKQDGRNLHFLAAADRGAAAIGRLWLCPPMPAASTTCWSRATKVGAPTRDKILIDFPSARIAALGDGPVGQRTGEHRRQKLLPECNDDLEGQAGRWSTV